MIILVAPPDFDGGTIEAALEASGARVERHDLERWWPDRLKSSPDAIVMRIGSEQENSRAALERYRMRRLLRATIERERVVALVDESAVAAIDGRCDFVLFPFREIEVVSRVERAVREPLPATVLSAGNIEVDVAARTVIVGGQHVELTFSEFELLRALLVAEGRAQSREELMRQVFQDRSPEHAQRVDLHVYRLRAKLGAAEGVTLETVRYVGYRLAIAAEAHIGV